MWKLSGSFDPESGLILHGRLNNAVSTLFHQATPTDAPDDPGERADYLRAQALLALTEGRATGTGRSEIIAVVHVDGPPDASPSPEVDESGRQEVCTAGAAPDAVVRRRLASRVGDGEFPDWFGTERVGGNENAGGNGNGNGNGNGGNENAASGEHTRCGENAGLRGSDIRTGLTRNAPRKSERSKPGTAFAVPPLNDGSSTGYCTGGPSEVDRRRVPSSPHLEWGLPVEMPWSVLHSMFDRGADVCGVVVRNGVVVYAPGELNLGRATRLASRAQRRALRALYPRCAMPGCNVGFDRTQPHHIIWREHGGPTDFDNLLPLCSRHHHHVQDDGWILHLDRQRTLTIIYPDGPQTTASPPGTRTNRTRRQAA